jgi:hypothetical protein
MQGFDEMTHKRKRNVIPAALSSALGGGIQKTVGQGAWDKVMGKRKNPTEEAIATSFHGDGTYYVQDGYNGPYVKAHVSPTGRYFDSYPIVKIKILEGRNKGKVTETYSYSLFRPLVTKYKTQYLGIHGPNAKSQADDESLWISETKWTDEKSASRAYNRLSGKGELVRMLVKGEDGGEKVVKENPPKKGRRNPSVEEAESLSEKWHGRKPKTVTEVVEEETYEENLAELADLEELGVLGSDLVSRFTISFPKNRPKLCASDSDNLELVGGDQSLKDVPEGVIREGKVLVPLGYLYQIVYESDKFHLEGSNGVMESYEHYFGEEFYKESMEIDDFKNSDDWFEALLEDGVVEEAIEDGLIPMLVYNKTDEKMLIVGGKYTVEDVGIKN